MVILFVLLGFIYFQGAKCEEGLVEQVPMSCTFYRRLSVSLLNYVSENGAVTESVTFKLDTESLVSSGKFSGDCEEFFLIEESVLDGISDWDDVNETKAIFSPFYVENGCNNPESSFFFEHEFDSDEAQTFILLYDCEESNRSSEYQEKDFGFIFLTSNENCSVGIYDDSVISEEYTPIRGDLLRATPVAETSQGGDHTHAGGDVNSQRCPSCNNGLRCTTGGSESVSDDNHPHRIEFLNPLTSGVKTLPEYTNMNFCKRSHPILVEGDLVLFDTDINGRVDSLPDEFDEVSEEYKDRFIRGSPTLDDFGEKAGGWDAQVAAPAHTHDPTVNVQTDPAENVPPYYTFRIGKAKESIHLRNYWQHEGDFVMLAEMFPSNGWDRHVESLGSFIRVATTSGMYGGEFWHHHHVYAQTPQTMGIYVEDGKCCVDCGSMGDNTPIWHIHEISINTWSSMIQVDYTGLVFLKRKNLMKTVLEMSDEYITGVPESDDDTEDDDNDDDDDSKKLTTTEIIILASSLGAFLLCLLCVLFVFSIIVVFFVRAVVKKRKNDSDKIKDIADMVGSGLVGDDLEQKQEIFEKEREEFYNDKREHESHIQKLNAKMDEMKASVSSNKTDRVRVSHFAHVPIITDVVIDKPLLIRRTKGMQYPMMIYKGRWKGKNVLVRKIPYSSMNHMHLDGVKVIKLNLSIIMSLSHPSILKYHGYCDVPGDHVLIVSDDVESLSFSEIARQTLEFGDKIEVLKELTVAMHYLHAKNINHGNLCPSLIYLNRNRKPIIDLGFDKLFSISHEYNPYAAPEVVNPNIENIDEEDQLDEEELKGMNLKSDIYSFGILIYSLLTQSFDVYKTGGREVKVGINASQDEKYRPQTVSINQKELQRMPPWWINLVDQCTSKYPMERPSFTNIVKIVETVTQNV